MAERRMFAKTIIGSARFLRMPPSSRLLYYDLGMYADDEGVVEAYTVMKQTNATEDDLRVLVSKGFVRILNEDLVTVIMDWNENNYIRNDRRKKSIYRNLLLEMGVCQSTDSQMSDTCQSNVSIGKDRLVEDSIAENNINSIKDTIRTTSEAQAPDELKPIIEAWNKLPDPVAKIRAIKQGTVRHKMLKARIAEYGVDGLLEAIDQISHSPFLLGRKTGFIIVFDWFIKPNNFVKVYEGNYVDRNVQPEQSPEQDDGLGMLFGEE